MIDQTHTVKCPQCIKLVAALALANETAMHQSARLRSMAVDRYVRPVPWRATATGMACIFVCSVALGFIIGHLIMDFAASMNVIE